MAVKKKTPTKPFHIKVKRGLMQPILVGVEFAKSADDALTNYMAENGDRLIPGNQGTLPCGCESISVDYYAEAVK